MFNVVLYQPEIPPNTGNIIRLCANSGAALHLIEPLGFDISEKAVRRAGMDYADLANVRTWRSLDECLDSLQPARWFAISTRGAIRYDTVQFAAARRIRVRAGDSRVAAGAARALSARAPFAPADARRKPQPEPFELGGRRCLRGVAPTGIRGK